MGDCMEGFPEAGERLFRILAFDWDGTAVPDRHADARRVAAVLQQLLKLDVLVAVITGTNFENIDRQLCSLIHGPHKRRLYVCANRGSEVFGFDIDGNVTLLFRREATPDENRLLDRIAQAVKSDIESLSSVGINIIYDRLNRRKVDLIPEWPDPPKSRIDELMARTEARLKQGGYSGGIHGAYELTLHYARRFGLKNARVTSDVKHIEVGLTDKSDSIRWVISQLCYRRNIPFRNMLVGGDEFGNVAGFDGSDSHMIVPELGGDSYIVSVGKEPDGVPPGVTHLPGGPDCFISLLERQVALHRLMLPSEDVTALLVENGFNPLREREVESLLAVGNGYLGTRGSLEEQDPASSAATLLAGVYDRTSRESIEELVVVPDWLYTRIYVNNIQLTAGRQNLLEHRRVLDMSKGMLFREWRHRDRENRVTRIRFIRFASLADPHLLVERLVVVPENYSGKLRVETGLRICEGCPPELTVTAAAGAEPPEDEAARRAAGSASAGAEPESGVRVSATTVHTGIALAQRQQSRPAAGFINMRHSTASGGFGAIERWRWRAAAGQPVTIDKYVSVFTSRESTAPDREAAAATERLAGLGFRPLALQQIGAWRDRLAMAAVTVDDNDSQQWLNFALYHLISAGNPHDERSSISARALTGSIYKGHIFWDAEMFILPFFIFTHPPTARAMLLYRFHTLAAARENALRKGYAGALFAWEATGGGEDMTPAAVVDPRGEIVPVLSGKLEHHISAAVAWGAWSYWNASGDEGFLVGAGAELLIETARFWASRVTEVDGGFHILGVEGPDEYHDEGVDDNYYTNAMARWNLRRAAEVVERLKRLHPDEWQLLAAKLGFDIGEPQRWLRVAGGMFMGAADTGSGAPAADAGPAPVEQFRGYFELEDIDVSAFGSHVGPLDVLLGHERTVASQVVKQADVVMALYLLEEELGAGAIEASFDYYEPRTVHGSSLSPAIYGLVAARLGRLENAWSYFSRAARIDLAHGNAAGGIHVAALGGLWQQVVMGFAGVRTSREGVFVYPQLPERWGTMAFMLTWRGLQLRFAAERGRRLRLELAGEGEAMVGIKGLELQAMTGGRSYTAFWQGGRWQAFSPAEGAVTAAGVQEDKA
jgi:kojibiose phosphorylase